MIIKHFSDREEVYRFLKNRIGVFFKEAEERSSEGIYHCIYFRDESIPPDIIFRHARNAGIKVFSEGRNYAIFGLESQIKDFCQLLVKENEGKKLAFSILESLLRYERKYFKIVHNRKILNLGLKTAIMGILNITPDSFYDGGRYIKPDLALKRAEKLIEEGADIIDIGGESTRPGSERISAEEEINRILPVLKEVRKKFPDVWISVDTYKSSVAEVCLEEGADIINDISGGTFDPNIYRVVSKYRCPYVINHIKGKPETWKSEPIIYEDVVCEIKEWLEDKIGKLKEAGYRSEENIIIDPGIGFGKNPEDNLEIIKRLDELKILGKPILVGISRKSFIGVTLELLLGDKKYPPEDRLYGTIGATAVAVLKGANIIRTHDVKETREAIALVDAIRTFRND